MTKLIKAAVRRHRRSGRSEKFRELDEITLRIVDGRTMTGYNRRYKGRSYGTDVLAFETGDVLVSMSAARRQAREFGHSLKRELLHLGLHGILHLAGFRDAGVREKKEMEEETIALLGRFISVC